MAYDKTTWINDTTPLNADNLNHIEDGIEEAMELAEEALVTADSKTDRVDLTCTGSAIQLNGVTQTFAQIKALVEDKSHDVHLVYSNISYRPSTVSTSGIYFIGTNVTNSLSEARRIYISSTSVVAVLNITNESTSNKVIDITGSESDINKYPSTRAVVKYVNGVGYLTNTSIITESGSLPIASATSPDLIRIPGEGFFLKNKTYVGSSFSTDDWETIAGIIRSGHGLDLYFAGGTKTITVSSGGTDVNLTVTIVDTQPGRYKYEDGTDTHFTFLIVDANGVLNNYNSVKWAENSTNYSNSTLHSIMNSTILAKLPSSLRNVLKPVIVYSGPGTSAATSSNLIATSATLFAPCYNEIGTGTYGYANTYECNYPTGARFDYFGAKDFSAGGNYVFTRSSYNSGNVVTMRNKSTKNYQSKTNELAAFAVCFAI